MASKVCIYVHTLNCVSTYTLSTVYVRTHFENSDCTFLYTILAFCERVLFFFGRCFCERLFFWEGRCVGRWEIRKVCVWPLVPYTYKAEGLFWFPGLRGVDRKRILCAPAMGADRLPDCNIIMNYTAKPQKTRGNSPVVPSWAVVCSVNHGLLQVNYCPKMGHCEWVTLRPSLPTLTQFPYRLPTFLVNYTPFNITSFPLPPLFSAPRTLIWNHS